MKTLTEQEMSIAATLHAFEALEKGMTSEKARGLRVLQLTEGINDDVDKAYLMALEKVIEFFERPMFA